jgi:hypothetical protein
MQLEGTIGIHQSLGGNGARFGVTFAPYAREEGGTCGIRRFDALQQVGAFLKALGIRKDLIAAAIHQLAAGLSAVIPSVVLSEEVIQRRGLDSTATLTRRMS